MKKIFWVVAVAAAFTFASCQKENATPATDANLETAIDGDQVDGMYDEVSSEVDQAMLLTKAGVAAPDSSGKRVVVNAKNADGTYTKTITFTNWKIGKNQRWTKSGKIIINISPLTLTRTVTFDNLYINSCKIEGVKTMVLNGNTLTVTLKDGMVTFADGTIFKHAFTKVWTRVKGADTPLYIWDDEYDITINATGVNRRGNKFTEVTTTPLHFNTTWPVFVSGEVKREVGTHTIITNYGSGAEDFTATITVDGVSKEVNLLGKK